MHLQMASERRREGSPSDNGTNELIANLDHAILDVRVRALKCLLRKLECRIITSDSLKDRVDLLDRCRRWLSRIEEQRVSAVNGNIVFSLDSTEVEGLELLVQLLYTISQHKEFRDLMRKGSVDTLLSKIQPFIIGDYKCQLDALINSLVIGQYELSYEGLPSEWYDNKTCPVTAVSSKTSEMFSSHYKPFNYKPYDGLSVDQRSTPSSEESDPHSNPVDTQNKKASIPLGEEEGWIQNIPFFVPHVQLSMTDKRILNSTVDSLSATSESLVLMTANFIRDTLTMDYPAELFIQESSLILALAQVTVSRWSDSKISYTAIQTLLKISRFLRLRFTQLNTSERYQVPTGNLDQKPSNLYYDYDALSYSSRMASKSGSSTPSTTDALIENFVQLFKSFSRALQYTSYDLHLWPVFDSFAFTMFKCVSIFPVDSKALTLSLQGILMELAHIWERKSDVNTTVGLCLVSGSILNSMRIHNETFIVSKDVRSMLRSLSYSQVIRIGWPELFEHFAQFSSMFDPSAGLISEQKDGDMESSENHPKRRILKLLYAIQNASSHGEVLDSVSSLRDLLLPITLNTRIGEDSVAYVLQDAPWRDTFYRFLCVEPTTEGDEELLGRVLDLFAYILCNTLNASTFKWIMPLCCEKSSTTLKLLSTSALQKEMKYGGTALPDLLYSLLEFYSATLKHENIFYSPETKWEIFMIYTAILHHLENSSYSNFALLTAITKDLANISGDRDIQAKIKENPILSVALIHRVTDAVMVLDANGGLFDGFKNSCALYYLGVNLAHMLIPLMKDQNYKNFKGDWIERCARTFQILAMSGDPQSKCQAFQVCEFITSSSDTKSSFVEASLRNSEDSLLETAYRTFVDLKQAAFIKFRAGNILLNILKDENENERYNLAKQLKQVFPVLVDMSRLTSRVLWNSKLSTILKNVKPSDRSSDVRIGPSEEVLFITPRVLTVLCRILMAILHSSEPENTFHEVTSSGICQMLFRIILRHPLTTETDSRVWLDCCCSVSTVIETLISLSKLDRTISVILIGEKKCLSMMFSLLDVKVPVSAKGVYREKAEEVLSALCGNILNLATVLCCDAGNNFEDLERVAWAHEPILFAKLTDWLKVSTPVVSRKCALSFTQGFFSVLSHRQVPDTNDSADQCHPFLCRNLKDNLTYGQSVSENLINLMKQAVDAGERMSAMKSLTALFSLSGSSVRYAVEENDLVHFCVQKLQSFGCKYLEAKGPSFSSRKSSNALHVETLSYMELLSCLFYVSPAAKANALKYNFPDVLHKIFAWWTSYPDLSLLHAYIEALLNFTEEFPEGALALTLTSNVVGVGPRRVPTQQSIFTEILAILEKELSTVENNPNLKTVEIIFELLKNICFVQECRNILLKSSSIIFLRKLHSQETKKWSSKQIAVKIHYLGFMVHASAHADVQTCIAKIPEGIEILVQIVESDHHPASTLALKMLRNLCFQQANRGRLLSENIFMTSLSNKLSQSTELQEIENAAISLWALIANHEKGRLNAKKSYCGESLSKALVRVRKMEQTTNSENEDISRVISLLETVQQLLGTSNPAKLTSNSRSSSLLQQP